MAVPGRGGWGIRMDRAVRDKAIKRLYSLPEAAIYLGRSTWSVRRLIWNGELPEVRAGGRVHVDVRDMDDFIERAKMYEEDSRLTRRGLDRTQNDVLSDTIT